MGSSPQLMLAQIEENGVVERVERILMNKAISASTDHCLVHVLSLCFVIVAGNLQSDLGIAASASVTATGVYSAQELLRVTRSK